MVGCKGGAVGVPPLAAVAKAVMGGKGLCRGKLKWAYHPQLVCRINMYIKVLPSKRHCYAGAVFFIGHCYKGKMLERMRINDS